MIRLVFALSLLLGLCSGAAADPLKDSVPSVSVTGEATEEVAPDRATLRFGVVSERASAPEAAAENARIVAGLLTELKAFGIADADTQTQVVTLEPVTTEERDPKGKTTLVRKHFRARNELAARVKPIDRAGEIISRLIAKGANSFDGIDYDFADPAEKMNELRTKAVQDAQTRAEAYARGVNLKLSRVLEIRPAPDEAYPVPQAFGAAKAQMAEAASPTPVRPGTQRLTARVTVTWALSR
jgi:hypothetical protein